MAGTRLDPPVEGSIEAALIAAGRGEELSLTDLRASRGATASGRALTGIRTQSAIIKTPLIEAFDAVVSSPTATTDEAFPRLASVGSGAVSAAGADTVGHPMAAGRSVEAFVR
ncbi:MULTISPECIES: hypothetical protein [Actinoalloteichus]|uniref:hypothetical protein n=1 Tax=Actinoalloteichus TaxID=65496 RepID=UPI00095105F2|nr:MULTISPECIES: hypothetical protein [Actinoalloteichus]